MLLLLLLLLLNKMTLPFYVPDMFVDHSCVGLSQVFVEEWLHSLLVEQHVVVAYVYSPHVLDFGVLLRVPA